jgi:lipopolysaccharide/colanic/teichoic acid biosynthesis glycosyltransferase
MLPAILVKPEFCAMAKRLFDVIVCAIAIVLLSPVLLLAYCAVRLSSSGPALYRARRVGRGGDIFIMHKFRTMHTGSDTGSVITGAKDSRVFQAGRILRTLKIDELPQLYDILTGKMSIVGPRPEDPKIVAEYYSPLSRETLNVAPGLSSPGSIHYYTHSHLQLDDKDPERSYVEKLLPIKLAMDLVYLRRAGLWYDVTIMLRTAITILLIALGKRRFAEPPEFTEAKELMERAGTPLVALTLQQELS